MKKVFSLILFMNFISCTYINRETIVVEIHNKSNSVINDILFVTSNDTLAIKELKRNETVTQKLEFSFDNGGYPPGWGFSFLNNNEEKEERGCNDILDDKKQRILKLTILDDRIEKDYSGDCY